jgi:hypothetical protein
MISSQAIDIPKINTIGKITYTIDFVIKVLLIFPSVLQMINIQMIGKIHQSKSLIIACKARLSVLIMKSKKFARFQKISDQNISLRILISIVFCGIVSEDVGSGTFSITTSFVS